MSGPPPHSMLPPLGAPGIPAGAPSIMSPSMNSPPGPTSGAVGGGGLGASMGGQQQFGRPRSPPDPVTHGKAFDAMRAYRACLHCRNRKSKCDLDPNNGKPPCRRCQRENRECVLGESHRGGRRVRKRPKTEDEGSMNSTTPTTPTNAGFQSSPVGASAPLLQPFQSPVAVPGAQYGPLSGQPPPSDFHNRYDNRPMWQTQTVAGIDGTPRQTEYPPILSPTRNQPYRPRMESTVSLTGKAQEVIASAELQNPSDALEILAQVAERTDDSNSPRSDGLPGQTKSRQPPPRLDPPQPHVDTWHYKPIQDGRMSPEMVYQLFASYEQFFHPFFPIIPRQTFDRARFQWLSKYEPHLFSAILAVASKDDERVHQVCYDHMQQLISNILAGADADVEAVEALLLLSQWVSHRPQVASTVGRGEEDRVAWMYIGTALRLGYFLEIDRTSFNTDNREDSMKFHRKRLVWAACYICDRQVSVRVGKGFWARGPGPLSGLKANDFPTLQPASEQDINWALIFESNLELTQIFSNVHDILYSSKGHAWKEMLEGRYAKYLDDFRYSIRTWIDKWQNINCPSDIKASLLLTYDYLRLYVNAFAYQATISRALTDQRDSQHIPNRAVPLINSSAPDARFIYEAITAATSLLTRFNLTVDPQTLRHMPSSYFLFIIYSAVFLYKARSTTSMNEGERENVRITIKQTIERLQQSSVGANQMGSRYARLLELLWRRTPKRNGQSALHRQSIDNRLSQNQPQNPNPEPNPPNFDPSLNAYNLSSANPQAQTGFMPNPAEYPDPNMAPAVGTTFSWLDLPATFNYALQNGNSSSHGSGNEDGPMGMSDFSPADSGMGGFMDAPFLDVPVNADFMF